jgi:anti-sigma B factor antagonist
VDFAIRSVVEGQTTTLHVTGEVDLATAEEIGQAATTALDAGATALVIDLHQVTFLDSTGLAVLVAVNNHATAGGARLTIRGPSPRVRKVLRITGLDEFLPVEPDPDPGTG